MRHGSLFSGIGGFDLAAEWMGWENVFHCEINPFGQKVLKHYWPNAKLYDDITQTDFTIQRGRIDILSGGFPCQDASNAKQSGKGVHQSGINGDRTGLVKEMLRAVEEIKPRYVVAENVTNILKTNSGRDWFTIINSMASMGYGCEWRVCRASEVGAPHHRGRCYMVAYSSSIRIIRNEGFLSLLPPPIEQITRKITGTNVEINTGGRWVCESPVYNVANGVPKGLVEYIKAGGNAVVPPLVYEIFKVIEMIDNNNA